MYNVKRVEKYVTSVSLRNIYLRLVSLQFFESE